MAPPNRSRPSLLRPIFELLRQAILALAMVLPCGLAASPLAERLGDPQVLGSSTFRFLGLPVYDARLYTPGGAPFNWNQEFGLKLTYRRSIAQKALIKSTLDEMVRQGNPPPTAAQLQACFQAVSKGDSYLAISKGPDKIGFWRNGSRTCTLSSPGITRAFMSIFLGSNTRSANFTRQLKGQ